MSEKIFPTAKPANPTPAATANPTAATTNGGTNKSHLYNPTSRPPYRPAPYNRRNHHRPRRNICCRVCFWTILIILILALLASIAGIVLYVMYKPHRPSFSIPSLRVHRLNLTTSADSSSHISSLFNFTLSSKNPNSHLTFFYDPFSVTCLTSDSGVLIGNGTVPAFTSASKNLTTFRAILVSTSQDLDSDSVNGLRSDLKKKGGVPLKLEIDTRVEVKMEGFKSKKVGIRVTCDGIKAALPKGKSPALANTGGAKCKVDLRIKIWKWTF